MPTATRPCWWSAAARPGSAIAARLTQLRRHAGRRPRGAHRRQLAQALPRADAAQSGAGQPPALHAVPGSWPVYIPKDKLANWFELYAEAMELNVWTGTGCSTAALRRRRRWTVDAAPRRRKPTRRCIRATSCWQRERQRIPIMPDIPDMDSFRGVRAAFRPYHPDGEDWTGKPCRRDRHRQQRPRHRAGPAFESAPQSRWCSAPRRWWSAIERDRRSLGNALLRGHRRSRMPTCIATPCRSCSAHKSSRVDRRIQDARALLEGSERVGFKLDFGSDGTGWQFKYLSRGGGYYFDVGCSQLIVEGEIALCSSAIERLSPKASC